MMRKVKQVSSSVSPPGDADLSDEEILRLVETLTTKIRSSGTFQGGFAMVRKPGFINQLKSVILKWSKDRELLNSLELILKLMLEVCEALIDRVPMLAGDLLLDLVCFCMGVIASSPLAGSELLGEYVQVQKRLQDITLKLEETKIASGNPYYRPSDYIYDTMVPPEDFRDMTVIASLEELVHEPEPFLRPNKVIGQYQDGDHYLDVQFRLLRADFDIPLRRAFQQFLKNPREYLANAAKGRSNSQQDSGVRCYQDVTFSSIENYGKEILLNLPDRFVKKTNWTKSKRFLPGCLVVLTCDNLKTATFALTTFPPFDNKNKTNGRNTDQRGELATGKLRVTIVSGDHVIDKTKPYLLLESEAFFEAYRYNLTILQNIQNDSFQNGSLYELLAKPSSVVGPPSYLVDTQEFFMIPDSFKSKRPKDAPTTFESFEDRENARKAWAIRILQKLPPLEPEAWNLELMQKHLNLDTDQCIAVQAGLTRPICPIQGPPGTGKTYVGLQIAKLLLFNKRKGLIPSFPILFVCFTNHALDQILELLLTELPDLNVARVGGQSKSPAMEQYSLGNHRRRNKSAGKRYSSGWEERKREEIEAAQILNDLKEDVEKVQRETSNLLHLFGIVNFQKLEVSKEVEKVLPANLWKTMKNPVWLGLRDDTFGVEDFNVREIVARLFTVKEKPKRNKKKEKQQKKVVIKEEGQEPAQEEHDMDELMEHRVVDVDDVIWLGSQRTMPTRCMFHWNFSVRCCAYEAKKLQQKVKGLKTKIDWLQGNDTENRFEQMLEVKTDYDESVFQLEAERNREKLFAAIFGLYNDERLVLPDLSKIFYQKDKKYVISSNEIMRYPIRIRWAIYFAVVQVAHGLSMKRLELLTNKVNAATEEFSKARNNLDGTTLREMDVIGMTTTGAAKNHDLLEMARPNIVIVEEAAEVLEAHIVTSLTDHCKHLILIGDHLQLRPSVNVFQLETKYRLNISLFERLILNGVPHCTLKTQHRMHPEISDLIIGPIYKDLHNHPTVYNHPSVRGVKKRMFFVNHNEREQSDGDLQSKSNRHEASFLLALCEYLLQQEYNSEQITILTTYTGQMFQLRKMLPESCKNVRVTCVDNYQGEENDIILLSLVRSNTEDKVGFMRNDNRICVALSRARHGLYVIGNMDCMVAASKTWKAIVEKLKGGGNIGTELELSCQSHGNLLKVKTKEDFRHFKNGGCGNECKVNLECGHFCTLPCHGVDQQHERLKCKQNCRRTCEEGHLCTAICSSECPPCRHPVVKELPCDHQAKMKCSKDPETFLCKQLVDKILFCGHSLKTNCSADVTSIDCQEHVKRILPCGHEHLMECHTDFNTIKCNVENVKVLPCGHSKKLQCHVPVATVKCKKQVLRILNCQHEKKMECCKNPANVVCNVIISKTLSCGHSLESPCGNTEQCQVSVEVVNPICSHVSTRPCHDSRVGICLERCARVLKCGHNCPNLCHMTYDPNHVKIVCKAPCQRNCISGHPCKYKHACNLKCFPCEKPTKLTLPCGHVLTDVKCSQVKQKQKCTMKVPRVLACGHEQQVLCYMNPEELMCTTLIVNCAKKCRLGHPCSYEHACYEDCPPCEPMLTTNENLTCGHKGIVPCSISPDQFKCDQMVFVELPCSHNGQIKCHLKGLPVTERSKYAKCMEPLELICAKCKFWKVTLKCYEKREQNFCKNCRRKPEVGLPQSMSSKQRGYFGPNHRGQGPRNRRF